MTQSKGILLQFLLPKALVIVDCHYFNKHYIDIFTNA